ncbi:YkgJ family cysteine cluster protein [Chlamydiota bacterium]
MGITQKVSKNKFNCRYCGNCCRIQGYVYLDDSDVSKISRFLGFTEKRFIEKYTRVNENRYKLSLIERKNGACVFLNNNKCLIYTVRPWQCKSFPYKWTVSEIEQFCSGWNVS